MKRRKRSYKTIVILLVPLITLLVLLPVKSGYSKSLKKEAIEWRMQVQYPMSLFTAAYQAKTIVNAINERCTGKLHITLYSPGQLVPPNEMYTALSEGVYDAAYGSLIRYSGRLPEAFVNFGLPMSWRGNDEVYEFFYNFGYLNVMRKACEREHIFYAAPAPCGDLCIFGNFPLRTAGDLRGKKIFVAGANAIVIKKLGGVPLMFDMSELYSSLKLGTVDGAVHMASSLTDAKFGDVCKYITYPALVQPLVNDVIINTNSWKALPDDVQKTVLEVLRKVCSMTSKSCQKHTTDSINVAEKKYGIKFVTMSDSEGAKISAASKEAWTIIAKKNKKAAKTVQMLRDFVKSKGR